MMRLQDLYITGMTVKAWQIFKNVHNRHVLFFY